MLQNCNGKITAAESALATRKFRNSNPWPILLNSYGAYRKSGIIWNTTHTSSRKQQEATIFLGPLFPSSSFYLWLISTVNWSLIRLLGCFDLTAQEKMGTELKRWCEEFNDARLQLACTLTDTERRIAAVRAYTLLSNCIPVVIRVCFENSDDPQKKTNPRPIRTRGIEPRPAAQS